MSIDYVFVPGHCLKLKPKSENRPTFECTYSEVGCLLSAETKHICLIEFVNLFMGYQTFWENVPMNILFLLYNKNGNYLTPLAIPQ